jgi:hypothetical protein
MYSTRKRNYELEDYIMAYWILHKPGKTLTERGKDPISFKKTQTRAIKMKRIKLR